MLQAQNQEAVSFFWNSLFSVLLLCIHSQFHQDRSRRVSAPREPSSSECQCHSTVTPIIHPGASRWQLPLSVNIRVCDLSQQRATSALALALDRPVPFSPL